jgi:hypothetical protein
VKHLKRELTEKEVRLNAVEITFSKASAKSEVLLG